MLFSPEAKPSIRAKITALNIHGADAASNRAAVGRRTATRRVTASG
jgi:hypothetical protein